MLVLILSVIPSIILFVVTWRSDKVEKEPAKLLIKLFLFGALTIISALIFEFTGITLLSKIVPDQSSMVFSLIYDFLIVGLAEEAGKFIVLKKITWKNPEFNYIFDAVVYSVTVSLGFATIENIKYLRHGGIWEALARGTLSVPAHVVFAIYMGYFYGLAKNTEIRSAGRSTKKYLIAALIVPILFHGLFDFGLDMHLKYISVILPASVWLITMFAIDKISLLHVEISADPVSEENPSENISENL